MTTERTASPAESELLPTDLIYEIATMSVGVRITHRPTGAYVYCATEGSQYRNQVKALRGLSAMLAASPSVPSPDNTVAYEPDAYMQIHHDGRKSFCPIDPREFHNNDLPVIQLYAKLPASPDTDAIADKLLALAARIDRLAPDIGTAHTTTVWANDLRALAAKLCQDSTHEQGELTMAATPAKPSEVTDAEVEAMCEVYDRASAADYRGRLFPSDRLRAAGNALLAMRKGARYD